MTAEGAENEGSARQLVANLPQLRRQVVAEGNIGKWP